MKILKNLNLSDYHLKRFIYPIGIIAFLVLYGPINSDAFRGEMWELLSIFTQNQTWLDKFNAISGFVCFGSGRFQPLAFFIPYFHAVAFNFSFTYSHLFAQFIHLGCAALTSYLCYQWTSKSALSIAVFILTIFSFLSSDVITWTFFTYIQIHALLLLFCVLLTKRYIEQHKKIYLVLGSIFAVISSLIYEAGVSILIAQVLTIGFFYRKRGVKNSIKDVMIPFSFLIFYFMLSFSIGHFNYKDSDAVLQVVTFLKPIFYFIYYLRYSLGFSVEPQILNIGWIYELKIDLDLLNFLILGISIAFIFITIALFIARKSMDNFFHKKSNIFLILLTYFYILILAYGRVPVGAHFFDSTGLETQFRYYYVCCFLFPLIGLIFISPLTRSRNYLFFLLTCVLVIAVGNVINIEKYNKEISLATLPLTNHSNFILLEQVNAELNNRQKSNTYITRMHRDWYLEEISSPRIYRPFTFNANTCLSHPEYTKNSNSKKYQVLTSQDNNLKLPKLNLLKEIDLSKANILTNSQHLGSGPKEAVLGTGMWHVNHIPLPPQESWVIFDFGSHPVKLNGMSFLPRPQGSSLFWDHAIIQGDNSDGNWINLVEIKITAPPPDGWIQIPFENRESYPRYRLKILGGFSSERFIALSGIKAFSLPPSN